MMDKKRQIFIQLIEVKSKKTCKLSAEERNIPFLAEWLVVKGDEAKVLLNHIIKQSPAFENIIEKINKIVDVYERIVVS